MKTKHLTNYGPNARLIAAAPRLYETLKAMQKKLCESCPCVEAGESGEHSDECLDAMDLITEIEGRQE